VNASHVFARTLTLLCALAGTAGAQLAPYDSVSARSVSGQFIVYSAQQHSPAQDFSNDATLLKLDPSLVAVSCERIKQVLASELGPGGQWRGKVHLALRPAQSADDEITLIAERFKDGWGYRLEVPNPVERKRFVRGVVQALLLEEANRQAGERSAEIPVWLAEGLARNVLAAHELEVILPPPRLAVNRLIITPREVNARRSDSLATARRDLREHAPLTLEELSWPKDEQLLGAAGGIYRSSAQVFVSELLRFPDGRACLHAMLEDLPKFYNWQMAFLSAFKPHFQRQLDVEKWWALQVEWFTGRDASGLWTPEESWVKLDRILRAPVQVRRQKKDLPAAAEVPLSTVIREWDFDRQKKTLRAKLGELDGARQRVAPGLLPLVDEYRRALADYLTNRDRAGLVLPGSKVASPGAKSVVRETLRRFDVLESQRQELKPKPAAPVASAATETAETSVK
jgi:hypothetical protein